ncbi:hypothetical protein [Catenuloplanes indicus]|uniref:Uncharacterized protein n=1 Tax=Catenuloplanes indicus TaxID=137267 RepID=A0AAE3VUL9_9ACTN|nr:hypothetical protein [Catenuloplanes indicus]MDQ0364468.1 hypothetical protein [Catenuloplanes indicus]
MSAEAPADYVAFVGRRLPELRARVAREVPALGLERAEVLAEVLSGLAGRWSALRAAAMLLRRPGLVDRHLDRIVRREARRWRERQIYPMDLVVWETPGTAELRGAPEPGGTAEFRALAEPVGTAEFGGNSAVRGISEAGGSAGTPVTSHLGATAETFAIFGTTATGAEPVRARPAPSGRVSVALRRAAVLDSTVRLGSAALAEASIAWWHAFEARRRAGRMIRLTAVALLVLIYLTAQL